MIFHEKVNEKEMLGAFRHMKENNKSMMQCIFIARRGSVFAS